MKPCRLFAVSHFSPRDFHSPADGHWPSCFRPVIKQRLKTSITICNAFRNSVNWQLIGNIWTWRVQANTSTTALITTKYSYNSVTILKRFLTFIISKTVKRISSFIRSLSYERSTASSKANSPHRAIWCFLLQFPVSSGFLKDIQ
jgi:hypothetical protein